MPYIGKQLVRGQNRKLDDISSGFNGSQTTFTLQIASQNVSVGSALQLWISVGGVIQNPLTDFTIAGNQITFTTAPAASLDFFGVIQGDVTDTNTPGDATVTTSKLATGLTVNLADGSAATSSLQLGGTDSGLFSSAADKVNVTTGGVERLEIGSSEVVFNDGSNDVDFRVESNGQSHMLFVDGGNDRVEIAGKLSLVGGTDVRMELGTNGTTGTNDRNHIRADGDILKYNSCDNGAHIFEVNGTERLRIDSSGNVGIGTSSPTQPLDVVGWVKTSVGLLGTTGRVSTASGGINISTGATANPIIFTGGTGSANREDMRIDSSGNVGIGDSAPSQKLNVSGNLMLEGSDQFLYLTNAGTGNSGIYIRGRTATAELRSHTTGIFTWEVTGSEKMRIDSSGNVGIGTASPSAKLDIAGNQIFSAANPQIQFNAGGPIIRLPSANTLAFLTDSSNERMRLDSSGSLFINRTTAVNAEKFSVGNNGQVAYFRCTVNANHDNIQMSHSYATGGQTATQISIQNAALSQVGSIKSTASSTSFNTSSDYRLKENVIDIADGITRVKQLLPKRFNFIVNADKTVDGFLAHEAQAVVPEAVTGEKDGEEMQGIDQAKLVPLLTAALQEAIAKIETLEQRLSDAGIA